MAKSNEYLEILRNATKVSGVRWWPKYIYHYTNLDNAISILKSGKIYSRNKAKEIMLNDNASSDILGNTPEFIKDYVRFYFRPKTPTQYQNEGYLPISLRKYGDASVPVPIFFAFSSVELLSNYNTMFSETALTNNNICLKNTVDEFRNLDFQKIYSDGAYLRGENLTPYRRAEVIIPNECDLQSLIHIWCRSNAEYVSLCYLLKENGIYEKYKNLIGIKESDNNIFFKNAVYISTISLKENHISILFKNLDRLKNKYMNMKVKLIFNNNIFEKTFIIHKHVNPETVIVFEKDEIISAVSNEQSYILEIHFDNNLVYRNAYSKDEENIDELPY